MRARSLATAVLAAALVVCSGATAVARQQSRGAHALEPLPRATFPMRSGHYRLIASRLLDLARRMPHRGGTTPGEVDKVILRMRVCVDGVTADGWVTATEAARCNAVMQQLDPARHPPR